MDPGIESGVAPESIKVLPHLQKNVLYYIVSVVMVKDHPSDKPVDPLLVFTHQKVKPISAALGLLDQIQELIVGCL